MIVDLQLGEPVCRKVALFQAKKVRFGIAAIGSKSGQLAALAASTAIGFYLFITKLPDWQLMPPALERHGEKVLLLFIRHSVKCSDQLCFVVT